MWYVAGGIVVLVVAFVAWRWTSVGRGARKRDERILKLIDPIGQKLDAGETVAPEEILRLARRPETRFMLFAGLREMNHSELIPSEFSSAICQAESALVYWMMHPNELQDPPEKIEHVEAVKRSVGGKDAEFHVFRYRMPEGHCAAKDGWLLGLAGPMDNEAEPYTSFPGAFSRAGDIEGQVKPSEIVDWYVDLLKQKGLFT